MSLPFLSDGEINLILEALGPDSMVERARELDPSNQAVLGARAAWLEARILVRAIIETSGAKANCPSEEVAETMAVFDLDRQLQAVSPTDLPYWRSLATLCSPSGPWPVTSHVWMPFDASVPRSSVRSVCLAVLTEVLSEHPNLNRAYLDGAIWQRHSPEVMIPVRFGTDDLGAVVVHAQGEPPSLAWVLVREARAKLAKLRKHPLAHAFERLLAKWVWSGNFIASPAGALLSDLGGSLIFHTPTPAFVAANGIPISIVVGDSQDPAMRALEEHAGGAWVGIGVDHRVIDPAEATPLHVAFSERVPSLLSTS